METMCRLIHATPRFQSYIKNLDQHFLDAMKNITRLAIIGHRRGLIGQVYREALIPLKTTHVLKLKELELGYYIIQDDLLDFLVAHSSTLEVRELLVVHAVFTRCISIVEFHSCFLFRHKYLAKSVTAPNIQHVLSQSQSVLQVRTRDVEVLVSRLRLSRTLRIAVCHLHTV